VTARAENLVKRFGDFAAVDGISFNIGAGEIYGFLGANGAGKTTAIRMMCGLLSPTSGTLVVAGIDVVKDPESVRRRIGYMSQFFSLYPDLTVEENLRFFGGVYGLREPAITARIAEVLGGLDMDGLRASLAGSLPLGFKQRLGLASAALHRPEVIFLDEPTSGVDPISRVRFWGYIRQLSKKEGMTVIVSTHFLNEAEYCDHILLMNTGRIAASGSPLELKAAAGYALWEVEAEFRLAALNVLKTRPGIIDSYSWGRAMRVASEPGLGEDGVRSAMKAAGIQPRSLTAVTPSLEDVFMRHYSR
jgi:ABC-2 type transport system ATP-binding protein